MPCCARTARTGGRCRRLPARGGCAAHITGGGLPGNLVRILPPARRVRIDTAAWPVPPIFNVLARGGRIAREEMFATFNMGVGVAAVVPPDRAGLAVDICRANGADGWIIG